MRPRPAARPPPASSASSPSNVTASPVHAKRVRSARIGVRPASRGPACALAKSSEPARPPFAGVASTVPAIRVDGSVRFQAARSTSRAVTAIDTSGTTASGASAACAFARPSPAASSASSVSAVSVPVATKSTRASRSAASPVSLRRASSGNGACASERRLAGDRAGPRDERETGHTVRRGIAHIAELEAFDRSRVRADAPRERADCDALDRDVEWQLEARRRRDHAVGRLELDVECARAQSVHQDAAREQRPWAPRQRDVGGDDARLDAAPGDPPGADRILQRAARALDVERAAAPRDELAREPREAGLRREHAKERKRDDEEHSKRGRERADEPADAARSARRGRGRSGGRRARHQNVNPTERWMRTLCTSCPYARSTRKGPSGERTRSPMP